MCGIVGYIGKRKAKPILINGLRRLEYRGYDSAGIATIEKDGVLVCKEKGKVSELDSKCPELDGVIGIGHTRWATHGQPSQQNAHPHRSGKITIVHNGIIENHQDLREQLEGVEFLSQTDSEVLAHLINKEYQPGVYLKDAVRKVLSQVVGTFGLVVMADDKPGELIAARRGSPLLVGVGDDECFVASDAAAIISHTDKVIYLEDNQLVTCGEDSIDIIDLENNAQTVNITQLTQDEAIIEKEGFDHFLIKEIFEQPTVIENTLRGRILNDGNVHLGGMVLDDEQLRSLQQIVIIGCGTAYYSGVLAKYLLEKLIDIPVLVEYASEFRYREAAIPEQNTLAVFMSQSGETADTLA